MMIERVTQVGGPIPAAFLKRKADDLCVIRQHSFHMCCVEAGIAYFCYLYHVVLSSLLLSILQRVPIALAVSATSVMHHGDIMRQIRDAEPGATPLSILPFDKIPVLNAQYSCNPGLFACHIVDHHIKMVKTAWRNAVHRILLREARQR